MSVSSAATFSPTAVLDENGDIVGVNQAWNTFGEQNGSQENYTAEGKNYLEISQQAGDMYGDRVTTELRGLLNGDQTEFTVVYPCHSPNQERWFRLYATTVPLGDDPYYLLIHHQIDRDSPLRDRCTSRVVDAPMKEVDRRDRRRLVTYSLSSGESATEGLLMAFDAIGFDLLRQDTTLQDWIDSDIIDALQTSVPDFRVTFRVWNYPISLTPHKVVIYTPERSSE